MTNKYKEIDKLEKYFIHTSEDSFETCVSLTDVKAMLEAAPPAGVEPVAVKLWLWKNGDHYLAYTNEYPCESQGGDPLTLGEPVGYAILKESFSRDTQPPADKDAELIKAMEDGYKITLTEPWSALTDEANEQTKWMVERSNRPFCDSEGNRIWTGATVFEAINKAKTAIDKAMGEV
jgi:hypothetical protein